MKTDEQTRAFLELACLRYDGADSIERRNQAREQLAGRPQWPQEHAAVAAATGAKDALATHLRNQPQLAQERFAERGWTLLHCLCLGRVGVPNSDALGCLDLLLEAGADPAARYDLGGYTFAALTAAIGHGERGPERLPPHPQAREIALRLLRAGASPNDPQALYNTMLSPGNGWLELLLEHGLKASDEIDWDMGTERPVRCLDFVLAHAAGKGDLGRMRLLLAHGADAGANDPYSGRTIATAALLRGQLAAVELLGAAGAQPDELTPEERFRLACLVEDAEQARRIHDQHPGTVQGAGDLLVELLTVGKRAMAGLLLELGADPNALDKHGASALHRVAWNGDLKGIDFLLQRGADGNLCDRVHGSTPKRWALFNDQAEAADRLP